jgi:predicted phosphodiesterase
MGKKLDQQAAINLLRDLALELGRTPTWYEIKKVISTHHIYSLFGSMPIFVQAAGLDPATKQTKIDNTIFEKRIEDHVTDFVHKEKVKATFEKTLIIGDTHFPFVHKPSLEKTLALIEEFQPKFIIQIGDLYDMLSHGKFPRSLNVYTPKEEMSEARKMASEMWAKIKELTPKAELHQVLGNHDIRPMKRILEAYPEAELFLDFEKWFKFDGVTTHTDIREELIINGICYIHGYRSKLGDHRDFNKLSTVTGHSHLGGVSFRNYGPEILFELNAGYLGDPESKALSYTSQKINNWTHGVGYIDHHGPRFIHF